jgi:hypothetical protein
VPPKLYKWQDRIGLFPLLERGIGITPHPGSALLDPKDQEGAFSATAGGDLRLLQHRGLAPLGNGMKIQIKARTLD